MCSRQKLIKEQAGFRPHNEALSGCSLILCLPVEAVNHPHRQTACVKSFPRNSWKLGVADADVTRGGMGASPQYEQAP
jgi:hypothetical protein